MTPPLPYVFRWNRLGRKGEACRVDARSRFDRSADRGPALAFGAPQPKNFNSIRIAFADGYATVTSGNAIMRSTN